MVVQVTVVGRRTKDKVNTSRARDATDFSLQTDAPNPNLVIPTLSRVEDCYCNSKAPLVGAVACVCRGRKCSEVKGAVRKELVKLRILSPILFLSLD